MKVIVAGFSKTGTKTIAAALSDLGYNVYDSLDHFWYNNEDWHKIFHNGGTIEDFKRMYENVDAVIDNPAYFFWEEIHEAFPDSKIVLTIRDEDKWYKSIQVQFRKVKENFLFRLIQVIAPTGRKLFRYYQDHSSLVFGLYYNHPFDLELPSEMVARKLYKRHQTYCLQNAPKDKLLVYSVKEGWEPLCKFLGKDVPDKPFPHENVGGEVLDKLMRQHPALIRIQREAMVSLGVFTALSVFAMFKLYKNANAIRSFLPKMKSHLWE